MKRLHKKWMFWVAVFLFQTGFGYFYDFTEYQKGRYFNPLESSDQYFQREILAPWNASHAEGDLQSYNRMAYSMVTFHEIKTVSGEPSAWVTPGYPLILAGLYGIFGFRFLPVVLFNALCLTLAYFFLFQFTLRNFGQATALVCLGLLIVNLRASMFVGYIYSECLFFFLLAWSLDLFDRYRYNLSLKTLVCCALTAGFALLVRPVAVAVLPLAFLVLILSEKKKWSHVALFVCGCGLFLGAWLVRNQMIFGRALISTNSFYAMAEGNQDFYKKFRFSDIYASSFNQSPYPLVPAPSQHPVGEVREALDKKMGFNLWKSQNQKFYAWLVAWRFKNLLLPYTQDMSSRNKWICLFLWLLMFPVALVGIFAKSPPTRAFNMALTCAALALLALPALAVIGNSLRYQIPTQLLLTPLAAQGWSRLKIKFFRQRS